MSCSSMSTTREEQMDQRGCDENLKEFLETLGIQVGMRLTRVSFVMSDSALDRSQQRSQRQGSSEQQPRKCLPTEKATVHLATPERSGARALYASG